MLLLPAAAPILIIEAKSGVILVSNPKSVTKLPADELNPYKLKSTGSSFVATNFLNFVCSIPGIGFCSVIVI